MFEILSPAARLGALIFLLIVGSVITSPNFGENFGHALGAHWFLIVFILLLWLIWRPIKFALRLFFEGLFISEGVKFSGVLRDLRPRRQIRRRWFW
jgi:hypothetical protein